METIEKKLKVLRERWKVEIDKRPAIELQAKVLKMAIDWHHKVTP